MWSSLRSGRSGTEEGAEVADYQLRDFKGGIVAAGVELRPIHDVGVVTLGEWPDRLEVVGEHGHTDPPVAHGRSRAGVTFAVVVARRSARGIGEPVQRDLGEDLIDRHQTGPVAEVLEQLVVGKLTHW